MKHPGLIRLTCLCLGLLASTITISAPGEGRRVELADEEEPLVLTGLRGGSQMIGAKVIRISNCVLDSLNVVSCQQLTIESSVIHRYANLVADRSLIVSNCEFYGGATWDTRGGSALFDHNVFTAPLSLKAEKTGFRRPTITGNSFLGPFQAVEVVDFSGSWLPFAALKLPLRDNYWGTSAGPTYPGGRVINWLEPWGAFCQHWDTKDSYLYAGFEKAAGGISDAYRPHPRVWVRAARAGQNVLGATLGHSAEILARPGRDLLVCFDLKSTVRGYAPRFSLLANDQEVPPKAAQVFTVLRNYLPISETSANYERTLNFIIPASQVSSTQLELKLKMDNRDISGYGTAGSEQVIWTQTLKLQAPFCRPLRLGVVPVNVTIPFWLTAKADASDTVKRLQAELPALWPLRRGADYQVLSLPPITISRGYVRGAFQGLTGGAFMTFALSRSASAYLEAWNASRPPERWLDRLVCVVPNTPLNSSLFGFELSSNEGAALGTYQSVVFVDEGAPQAVLHELGHSIGLYTSGGEQYSFKTVDNFGNPIARVYFGGKREYNGAMVQNAVLFNDTGFTDLGQVPRGIHHVPGDPKRVFFDFMGASTPIWIIPTSLESVYRGLHALLGACPETGVSLAADAAQGTLRSGPTLMGPPPAGHRRVLFTGTLRRYQDRDTLAYTYRVYPETVQAREVSLEDYSLTQGNRATLQYLEAFDAQGQPVQPRIPIMGRFLDPAVSPSDPPWFQTVDVPLTATRLVITDQELEGVEFLSLADDGAGFQAQLNANPAAGAILDTITLSWGQDHAAKTLPVLYQLYYSADGQNTWVPAGGMTSDSSLTIDARELPATDDLAFRLVAADPFRSAEARLPGFRVSNRAPVVNLESPRAGDAAPEAATWVLAASVFDVEDGAITTGEWRSSRDGVLGTNAVLTGVHLSAGAHTLTFTAQDHQGAQDSAAVQVQAGPVAQVDLAVTEGSLQIEVAGEDPTVAHPNRLQAGRLNVIRLAVRNGGVTNEARLSLFLTLENTAEQLLASQVITNWAPFELGFLEAAYVYPGAARYTLRAAVSEALVSDPVSANDSRAWAFTNQPPVAIPARFDVAPQLALDFVLSGYDPDGDPLEFQLVTGPTRGVLERLNATWRYRPLNAGQDAIAFTVSDGSLVSEPAAVTFFTTTTADPVPVPPSIVSADRALARVGQDFAHAVTVTAPPAAFVAYNLPTGLQIDPATGVISGRPQQPGEAGVIVEATKGGASSTQELKLRVEETFARWLAGFGLNGANADPNADPEGDGLTNLQEYSHQLNPTARDAEGGPRASLIWQAQGPWPERQHLLITFRQRKGGAGNPAVDYTVDGVRCRLEYSEDLGDPQGWFAGDNVLEVVESRRLDNGDGSEWISVRCAVPASESNQGFVRLLITPQ